MMRIISQIKNALSSIHGRYITYEEYSKKIAFLEIYYFQQSVRRANAGIKRA